MALKLSTGREAFPIEFDNGDKDCIYFNPNDPDLAVRLMESRDKISERLEKLNYNELALKKGGDIEIPDNIDDISSLTEEQQEALTEMAEATSKMLEDTKKIICDELDTAFDSEISSVVFKHCSPFAVVNGEYFIVQFINAITPEVQKRINKSNKEVEKKISKHTGKYQIKR